MKSEREVAAIKELERRRWGDTPRCAFCESEDVRRVQLYGKDCPYLRWQCRTCKTQFSIRTGTPMNYSQIPIWCWLLVFEHTTSGEIERGDVSRIARETGLQWKSVYRIIQRLRHWSERHQDLVSK